MWLPAEVNAYFHEDDCAKINQLQETFAHSISELYKIEQTRIFF